jgi:ankyrin repeat protein
MAARIFLGKWSDEDGRAEEILVSKYERLSVKSETYRIVGCGHDVSSPRLQHPGTSSIMDALASGNEYLAACIIESGVDINSSNPQNITTPLHCAAGCTNGIIAALLVDRGANINAIDKSGATPLHLAARFGHIAVVELLLRHGAAVNARIRADQDQVGHKSMNQGWIPLHEAAYNGHVGIAELLVKNGAQLDLGLEAETNRMAPLCLAREMSHWDVFRSLKMLGASTGCCAKCEKLGTLDGNQHWTPLSLQMQDARYHLPSIQTCSCDKETNGRLKSVVLVWF